MKKRYFNLYWLLLLALLSACASTGTTNRGANTNRNTSTAAGKEDLSKYRPKFDLPATPAMATNTAAASAAIIPTHHVNDKVNSLLDTIAVLNKSVRFAQGYRILAYSGTDRKAAMDLRKAIVNRIPEERDYLQYKQPTYRLKVGDYFSRVEAQQVLLRFKDLVPNAMIIVDQINVK
jgi:hypothetical protein